MFKLGYFLYDSKFSISGISSIPLSRNDASDTAVNASAYLDLESHLSNTESANPFPSHSIRALENYNGP